MRILISLTLVLLLAACTDAEPSRETAGAAPDTPSESDREGMMDGTMMREGMMNGMPGWMMSEGMMDGSMMDDMQAIHGLLRQHDRIERTVEDLPDGVRTTTTSSDPEVAELIRTHVRQMAARIREGRPIRHMDPLFQELFEHHEAIEMTHEDVPGGVRVTETSDDPAVAALIRQHAHAFVSEVVVEGMERAMRPTPLPEDYER